MPGEESKVKSQHVGPQRQAVKREKQEIKCEHNMNENECYRAHISCLISLLRPTLFIFKRRKSCLVGLLLKENYNARP